MAIDGGLEIPGQYRIEHLTAVAVDKHLHAFVEEVVVDLDVLQREHAFAARDVGELDDLFDQFLRVVDLVGEGGERDLERAEKLPQRKLDHDHHDGAADDDQNRGSAHKDRRGTADENG